MMVLRVLQKNQKLIILILVSTIARWIYYLFEQNNPLFLYPLVDEQEYIQTARQIIEQQFLPTFHFYHPPFYSFFLAILFFAGLTSRAVIILQFLSGIAGVVLLYRSFLNLNFKGAFVASLLWGIYPIELFMESRMMPESIFIFLIICMFYFLSRGFSFQNLLWAGIFSGLAIITRSQFFLFWFIFIIWALITKQLKIKSVVGFTVFSFLFPLLSILHNAYHTDGKLWAVSSNGPVNVYIGNSKQIDSTLNIRPKVWQKEFFPALYDEAGIHFYKDSNTVNSYYPYLLSGYLWKKTLKENAHLIVPLKNLIRKTLIVLQAYETPRDFDLYVIKKWNPLLNLTVGKKFIYLPLALFLYASLIFIVVRWKEVLKIKKMWLPAIMLLAGMLPSILVFNAFRYRLAAVPFILIFAVEFYREYWKNSRIQAVHSGLIILLGTPLLQSIQIQKIPLSETYDYVADAYIQKGNTIQAERYYKLAQQEAEKRKVRGVEKASTWINRAIILNQRGATDSALILLNRAVKMDSQSAMAYYNRAIVLQQKGRYHEALQDYNHCLYLSDRDNLFLSSVYFGRAQCYVKLYKPDKAMTSLNKAISLNPQNPVFYSNRGVLYGLKGHLNKAIRDFSRAIMLDSTRSKYYTDRAIAYLNGGYADSAMLDIDRAISLDTLNGKAYFIRGLLFLDLGKKEKGCLDLHRAQSLHFKPAEKEIKKYCLN